MVCYSGPIFFPLCHQHEENSILTFRFSDCGGVSPCVKSTRMNKRYNDWNDRRNTYRKRKTISYAKIIVSSRKWKWSNLKNIFSLTTQNLSRWIRYKCVYYIIWLVDTPESIEFKLNRADKTLPDVADGKIHSFCPFLHPHRWAVTIIQLVWRLEN